MKLRSDRGVKTAWDERGILRIGTGIVGPLWGQRQGRGRRGQTESAGALRSRHSGRDRGVVGDPGARARCATSRSATRGTEIVAMRRNRPSSGVSRSNVFPSVCLPFDRSGAGASGSIDGTQMRSRETAHGPPDPYPQIFGPARCTPPCASHHCRTASCEGPDSVHAPFEYSPPARVQIAAESAQAATQRMVTTRAAPIPVTALAHFLSTRGCRSSS
jgi:hypothetical protein